MKNPIYQKVVATSLLAVAVAFLGVGAVYTHKVYDKGDEFAEFGLLTFTKISDPQLVEDATFTGVARIGAKLYSTYDRSLPRGKKACPT